MDLSFNLELQAPHRSIKSLSPATLPGLTVLSGPNGCGKSQLLEAIESHKIQATDSTGKKLKSKVFQSTPKLTAKHVTIQDLQAYKNFVVDAKQLIATLENCLTTGLNAQVVANNTWQKISRISLLNAMRESIVDGSALRFRGENKEEFENAFIATERSTENRSRWSGFKMFFPIEKLNTIEEYNAEILSSAIYELVQYQTFMEVDASVIFYRYFEEYQDNAYRCATSGECLDNAKFVEKYGNSPWDELNALLSHYGFSHQFLPPNAEIDPKATKGYTASIVNKFGHEISINELSSGEKVIVALLLSAYVSKQNSDNYISMQAPDILLFDELDAHLHPSMVRMMFDVIRNNMLQQLSCRVLLTTHSPTTVALADSASNYRLSGGATHTLDHVDMLRACRELTDGFVQVMDGSQIAIVEGKDDPLFYRSTDRALRSIGQLDGTPTIYFIPASHTQNPSSGGGASAAEDWAEKLNDANLPNVHALLDNDGKRASKGAIKILLGRYSIENFILDPLSLAVALIVDGHLTKISATTAAKFPQAASIGKASTVDLQELVNEICSFIESKCPDITTTDTVVVTYILGKTVNMPDWICRLRGKDLVKYVRESIKTIDSSYIITKGDSGEFGLELGYLLKLWCQFPSYFPIEMRQSLHALQAQ